MALQIVRTLQKRFWLIVAGALIAAAMAVVLSLILPPSYEAQALLLITKLRPDVTLDTRFQTVSEEDVVNLSLQDEQLRRQTLVTLAKSPDLMLQVLADVREMLEPDKRSLSALQGVTEVSTQGNLLVLQAEAGSAEEAAALANGWARVYARQVNRLYSVTSPTYEQIQREVDEALVAYNAANSAVQAFELQSAEDELNRQIAQKQEILDGLQQEQLDAARLRVNHLLARLDRFDGLLLDAQGLAAQLDGLAPTALLTPGQAFALFNLEAGAFGAVTEPAYTLELSDTVLRGDEITVQQALDLLARLAFTLEAARADARAALDAESLDLLGGGDLLVSAAEGAAGPTAAAAIADLQAEINALQAELVGQEATRQDLDDARTVAQESYLTLVRKAAEVQILSQLTGVEVQLAAAAQPPASPATPGALFSGLVGAVGGAVVGVGLAFLWEWWPTEEQAPSP